MKNIKEMTKKIRSGDIALDDLIPVYGYTQEQYEEILSNLSIAAKSVKPYRNYILIVEFEDGERRIFNALPLIEKGIFQKLKDVDLFMQRKAEQYGIIWDDEVDIASEYIYDFGEPF